MQEPIYLHFIREEGGSLLLLKSIVQEKFNQLIFRLYYFNMNINPPLFNKAFRHTLEVQWFFA